MLQSLGCRERMNDMNHRRSPAIAIAIVLAAALALAGGSMAAAQEKAPTAATKQVPEPKLPEGETRRQRPF